jgi:FkbM family methyltransferase
MLWKTAGRIVRALEKLGLHVTPMTSVRGNVVGLRLQWRSDGPDAVRGTVVTVNIHGQPIRFFVKNDLDRIQSVHRSGSFYEQQELDIISKYFQGGTFVDIGCNVGNHLIYALKILNADHVIAFEPLPEALSILETNIAANSLSDRVTLHKKGLSNAPGFAAFHTPANNLGASRLWEKADGIEIARGDDLLLEKPISFIKIDTEGFELQVLEGIEGAIKRNRPILFVEVETGNIERYEQFCVSNGYHTAETFSRYDSSVNYLSLPIERNLRS